MGGRRGEGKEDGVRLLINLNDLRNKIFKLGYLGNRSYFLFFNFISFR